MDPNTQRLFEAAAGGAAGVLGVEDVLSTYLYTGNGSSQTITNGIDLAGEGGMVWVKKRSGSQNHRLQDTVQGITKSGISNTASAYVTSATRVTSVSSTGFSVGNDSEVNENTFTYTSWTFRKTPGFFDVVTYTGTGSVRTVAHNLGSVPGCIIAKCTSGTGNWYVYHRSIGNTGGLFLDLTAGTTTSSNFWNNTSPTATEFTLGGDANLNGSGKTFVAYVFAHDDAQFGTNEDESIIKCGSYTGNGSTGQSINLGWEPQWVLIKKSSTTGDWHLFDNMRGGLVASGSATTNNPVLYANTSGAEVNETDAIYVDSQGFNFRSGSTNGACNASGVSFIYIAIRRGPMKTPEAATDVFDINTVSSNVAAPWTPGFPVDMLFNSSLSSAAPYVASRLTGNKASLRTSSLNAEYNDGSEYYNFDLTTNTISQGWFGGTQDCARYSFRRAPGFFDVVAYTGTGVARTVDHNLGVAPELMIVKRRESAAAGWSVYSQFLGNTDNLRLDEAYATSSSAAVWNNTSPTSTVFTVGTDVTTNTNTSTYIAYLFATLPGISKVGSYTGTGSTLDVNCGFSAGARFVLIKRTDASGDWYLWDSARGITSGNAPYLLLNSTAAEVTNTDYIDPLSSGFQISSTAPAAINASGGSFIYLAVA
jgi:hypothetical protein